MDAEQDLRIRLMILHPQGNRPTVQHFDITQQDGEPTQQGEAPGLVRITVTSTTLNSAPPYQALSYTWGDQTHTTPILRDGSPVPVMLNLEAALRYLTRVISTPTYIWCDAICINQKDEEEKSQQVHRMRDIYSQAYEVIVWLGTGDDDGLSKLGMRWIADFGGWAKMLGIGQTPDMLLKRVIERAEANAWQAAGKEDIMFASELRESLSPEANTTYEQLVAGLQDILRRPYWSRIWIVQEVTMAKKYHFMLADDTVDADSMNYALRLLRNFRLWQLSKLGYGIPGIPVGCRDRTAEAQVLQTDPSRAINLLKVRGTSSMSMEALLIWLRNSRASDPRDRVFALLGLASDAEQLKMKPDYNMTCEEVYTQLTRQMLRQGAFHVLSRCVFESQKKGSSLNLQSWVRDWSIGGICAPLQELARDRSEQSSVSTELQPDFNASGGLHQPDISNCVGNSWKDPLKLSVMRIGVVAQVGISWDGKDIGQWLQRLQELSQQPLSRRSQGEHISRVVWRTAVADQEIRNHKTKPRLTASILERLDDAFAEIPLSSIDSQVLLNSGLGDYGKQVYAAGRGRRPCLLSSGHLGIGPRALDVEDHVVIICGASVPYALRPRPASEGFYLVGEMYTHGCMDGEATVDHAVVQSLDLY